MRHARHRSSITLLLLVAMGCCAMATTQSESGSAEQGIDSDNVRRTELKQWLNERRLYPLLMQVLEAELQSASDPAQRRPTAGQLAALYAWQLNTGTQSLDEINQRLDELLDEFPDAIPLQTQTGIAFGRYRRAKDAFETWIWDRDDDVLCQVAAARFAQVIGSTEEMIERWRDYPVSADDTIRPQQLDAAISQAVYLAGWSRYYESQTLSDANRQRQLLLLAEADFLELLSIDDREEFLKLTPQWFPLNTEWTCRLILGIGMVSQALGNLDQAEFAFNLLDENRVPLSIQVNRRVWRFHSMLFARQLPACNQLVRRWQSSGEDISGDIPFLSTVAMAGMSWPDRDDPDALDLTVSGLTGLTRANEFVVIDELLKRYDVAIEGEDFFSRWLAGYAVIKRAETGVADLRQAIGSLEAALEASRQPVAPVFRARCRYHYGFALYLDSDFAAASEQFRQAVAVLEQLDPVLAEHADWMQCQALYQLANADPSWNPALQFQLQQFVARWPQSSHAAQAAFMQIMYDLDEQSMEQSIAVLTSLLPDDVNYERARFEVCRLMHRRWSDAGPDQREQLAADLNSAAELYVSTVARPAAHESQTRFATVCLLAADVQLNQRSPDASTARRWLDRYGTMPVDIRGQRDAASEFQYLNLLLATIDGDAGTQGKCAEWLLTHAARPEHIRVALIASARLLEDELSANGEDPPRNTALIERAVDVYGRLTDEYEAAGITLLQEPVLAAAYLRLAELATLAERPDEALEHYRILHDQWPDELTYLLGIARSQMSLGNVAAATGFWRTISSGLPAGDPIWLESQYNLVLCLSRSEPGQALNVLEQTTLLVPDVPDPWRDKLQKLEAEIRQQLSP